MLAELQIVLIEIVEFHLTPGEPETVDIQPVVRLGFQCQVQAQLAAEDGRFVRRGTEILPARFGVLHRREILELPIRSEDFVRTIALITVVIACGEQ